MAPAPDWRTIPGMMELAEKAAQNGLVFSQAKFDRMWELAEAALVLPRLVLSILPQEGTGSFNTSADNLAGDGGHGIEVDWEKDVTLAINLVRGKLALWQQACDQGWQDLAWKVASPASGIPVAAIGSPLEWINWHTAILNPDGTVRRGCYALHGSWWVGVRHHYLRMGGTMEELQESARQLDRLAPRVEMTFKLVDGDVSWASNSNGTAPEPAAVCTSVRITGPAPGPVEPPAPVIPDWQAKLLADLKQAGLLDSLREPNEVPKWWEMASVVLRVNKDLQATKGELGDLKERLQSLIVELGGKP